MESSVDGATYRALDRAEREDAGRGLEFIWLNVESGYEYVALEALKGDSLVDGGVIDSSGSAWALGAGAGVRLIFLTLGARFRLARQSTWDLWTLGAELGLHLPLGALEPSFSLSAGYASLGSFDFGGAGVGFDTSRVDVGGLSTRLGAALDWYLNPLLSLGVQSGVELLILSRSPARANAGAGGDATLASIYTNGGDGIGLGFGVTAVAGLHF